MFYPIKYDQPVFRPPAEANSVIIQATVGCSWNKCAFCEMYKKKKFRVKNFDELKSEIKILSDVFHDVRRIFIADGNAFVLSYEKLIETINEVNYNFKSLQRISAYALPSDILSKSEEDLILLQKAGLKLLYIGIESGDDELLKFVNKGETYQSTLKGIKKAHNAGIDTSIMILNGLGGKKYSENHASNSARIINELNPKYLSVLTLSFPLGEKHYMSQFQGDYIGMNTEELIAELKLFIEELNVENTIFRTDHISNTIILKGVLSKNKNEMINIIDNALQYEIKHNR
ncbi:radical SAM protein [Bacteroidota bacterium]